MMICVECRGRIALEDTVAWWIDTITVPGFGHATIVHARCAYGGDVSEAGVLDDLNVEVN